MKTQMISASALVKAPAGIVYTILADYRTGHPGILPRQVFPSLEVLQGGVGAGTRIRFQMRVGGTTRTFQAKVSEPEPGRLLTESNYDEKEPSLTSVTTFRLEPANEGKSTDVTITTEMTLHPGLMGIMEGLFAPGMIRSVYQQELRNLASVAEALATAT